MTGPAANLLIAAGYARTRAVFSGEPGFGQDDAVERVDRGNTVDDERADQPGATGSCPRRSIRVVTWTAGPAGKSLGDLAALMLNFAPDLVVISETFGR